MSDRAARARGRVAGMSDPAIDGTGGMQMASEEEFDELDRELKTRLELVNSDPSYEGEQATTGDQLLLAVVGIVIPAVIMIGGWLIYA
jgi:hypothetical protein